MTRALRLLSVLLVLACVGAHATELKIVSWNIKRAVGANNPNSSQAPYVAKIINYLDPDVWLIQEFGGNSSGWSQSAQLAALDSFIANYITIFGPSPQRGTDYYAYVNLRSDGYSSCALVSRYPFKEAVTDVYIGSPGRGLTVAWLDVPGAGGVGVFTAHFKASGTTDDAQKRQTNAEMSRDEIAQWTNDHPNSCYVFGGDMNENEDPDLPPNYPIGTILPNGHAYYPISTMMQAGFDDPLPLDALGGKRSWKVNSLSKRFDYGLVSENSGSREEILVMEAALFNTMRFPSGQLPPGFVASDSVNASDHAALVLTVDANHVPGADVIGQVALESYNGGGGLTANLEFRTPGTTNIEYSAPITRNLAGFFVAENVPLGTYDVALKFDNWLRQVLPNVTVSAPSINVNFSLTNGDADDSNSVDLLDVNTVLGAFGGGPGAGDLNWDGSVDLVDLNITLTNFGQSGDT